MGEVNRGGQSGDLEKDIEERTGEGEVVDPSKELNEKEGWAKPKEESEDLELEFPERDERTKALRKDYGNKIRFRELKEDIPKISSEEPKDFDLDKVKKINPKRPTDLPDISTEPRVFDPDNPRPKKSAENLDEPK